MNKFTAFFSVEGTETKSSFFQKEIGFIIFAFLIGFVIYALLRSALLPAGLPDGAYAVLPSGERSLTSHEVFSLVWVPMTIVWAWLSGAAVARRFRTVGQTPWLALLILLPGFLGIPVVLALGLLLPDRRKMTELDETVAATR